MSIIAKKERKSYSAAPEGLHAAVCCDVVDLGDVETSFGPKHKVEFRWMLEETDPKSNLPYMVTARYNLSLHEKARLRAMLEGWRGKKFTEEELDGFDLEAVLGANCQIQVIHNLGDEGQVYANVQVVIPAAKGAPKLTINRDYVRVALRDKNKPAAEEYEATEDDMPF